jgi:hypothetical protein
VVSIDEFNIRQVARKFCPLYSHDVEIILSDLKFSARRALGLVFSNRVPAEVGLNRTGAARRQW